MRSLRAVYNRAVEQGLFPAAGSNPFRRRLIKQVATRKRALRELVAKTDFVTCDIQSSRTTYEWNPDVRPSLYDLVIRLEGGIHETSNAFWSYENTYTMQPLHKVNKRYDALTREYLSSIYVDELDSPALSERSRAKLPHMNLQTTEHAEQHT